MGDRSRRVVYQRQCHGPECGRPFFICRSCFRGQRYCSAVCRDLARRQQRRIANHRHQHSPEGRLDHRDRQRAYRRRHARRVTDQGSARRSSSGSIVRQPSAALWRRAIAGGRRVRCIACGRLAVLIELFMRRE